MDPKSIRKLLYLVAILLGCGVCAALGQTADPLPSWNDGPAKRGILDFVARTTTAGQTGFLPVEARIAVFDNDGTLWPEKPAVEGLFILSRVRAMAAKDPALREREPFRAVLIGDTAYFKEAGEEAIARLVAATHTGMTQEEFAAAATAFSRQAAYPRLGLPVSSLAYQPMVELLAYLRSRGFRTWICSGGTVEFIRVFSRHLYGIPPEQVIGSEVGLVYLEKDGKGRLQREPGLALLNDKGRKPVSLSRRIGIRPAFAAGNVRSGGDIAMLTYSRSGAAPTFQLLVSHDDGDREFAYREPDGASLKAAEAGGWQVVSMRRDWNRIFIAPTGEPERIGAGDGDGEKAGP